MKDNIITISAPGKIHLLGEHMVVYGKPALLAAVNLRVTAIICHPRGGLSLTPQDNFQIFKETVEPIVKKELRLKTLPPYTITFESEIPIGAGLGSSAAISACYIAALLSFLKVKWDLNLINKLTYQAEKIFHGNPSGGDNSTVVYGGLVWFRKEHPDLKIIQPIPFSIPKKLAKNFVLINTGKPKETTKEMVKLVISKIKNKQSLRSNDLQKSKFMKIFEDQEQLVKLLPEAIQNNDEKQLMSIIRAGERNLERIGVVSPFVKGIIRKIEKAGGSAKICGAGGKTKATGVLLCYHSKPTVVENIAKEFNLDYFKTALGVEGLKNE